jgi:hypothetical protein
MPRALCFAFRLSNVAGVSPSLLTIAFGVGQPPLRCSNSSSVALIALALQMLRISPASSKSARMASATLRRAGLLISPSCPAIAELDPGLARSSDLRRGSGSCPSPASAKLPPASRVPNSLAASPDRLCPEIQLAPRAAFGVCQLRVTAVSVSATPRLCRMPELSASSALAVGHDEEPLSLVAGANFGRAEDSRRNAVAHSFQWRDESFELSVRIPCDVLAEETIRPALIDHAEQLIDEPSIIAGSGSLSGDAVWLARIARDDAIQQSTPASAVE